MEYGSQPKPYRWLLVAALALDCVSALSFSTWLTAGMVILLGGPPPNHFTLVYGTVFPLVIIGSAILGVICAALAYHRSSRKGSALTVLLLATSLMSFLIGAGWGEL